MDIDVMWFVIVAGIVVWFAMMLRRQWAIQRAHEDEEQTPNPYHAVAIRVRGKGCDAARQVKGRRYLSTEAPLLPLAHCSSSSCSCQYVHFDDRRHYDRRGPFPTRIFSGGERRSVSGRRMLDGLEPSPGR